VIHFAGRGRVVMEGVLARPPERSIKGTRLYVKIKTLIRDGKSFKNTGRVLVSLPFLDQPLNYGDRVRFVGSLRHPTNFNNPGGFDYQRYLATRGIWATTFVDDTRKIIRVATRQGNVFWTWLELRRNRIRAFLDHHSTDSSAPILKALILGERGTIPEKVKEDFAISGAAHIMAISGLHLGIIAFFLFQGLLWIFRQSEWIALKTNIFKLSALLTMPLIILYTLIAGARVATVRATIMIIVYLVSILIDRPRNLYHTLALAALIITLIDPASILEPSFQLSFTAVLAILYLTPKFSRFLKRDEIIPMKQEGLVQWLSSWSRTLLLVSLAAIIGTGPFIAYHFNRFSPMGLISNFLVIPLLGFLAIPIGLFSSFISLFSTDLALPFIKVASWVVDLVVSMIHLLASLPGVSFHVVTPTVFEIALVYAFIAVVTNLRRSFFYKIALAVILCLGIGDLSYWVIKTHFNKTLRITSLDVGQGDSALIEFPGGKRALVDGGGFYDDSFDVGKNVIAPFLWKKKIQKIDFLVLTHPDPDHLNGLKFIARNFRVEELWDSGQETNSPFFLEFMTIVKQKGIRRISQFRGDEPRVINGVVVQPLHPRRDTRRAHSEDQRLTPNNRSLVLKLIFANQTLLFTGDIEREAEAELIASGVDLRSRVIKAPHHGSLTSSTVPFLKRVRPEIALFSGRPRRFYRLPNKRVLERYERLGSKVLRTDLHGAITIETNGHDLTISTFRKSFRGDVQ
jgi:competence protein ComEC